MMKHTILLNQNIQSTQNRQRFGMKRWSLDEEISIRANGQMAFSAFESIYPKARLPL